MDFFGQNDMYRANKETYLKIIDETLEKESFIRGNSVTCLEKKIAEFCKRRYAIAVNSGTDAILIALKALGIIGGDEIIVPSFSFVASVSPIMMLGAKPVFVDIDKESCMIQYEKIENAITEKTKGILAVDIFGECLEYEKIEKIAKKHNIFFIEDGAQSFGSDYMGIKAGSYGDVSTISFDVSKVVYGFTTGGIVLTDDEEVANYCKYFRGHGFVSQESDFMMIGINSQMSSVNAALISWKIDMEEKRREKRRKIVECYDSRFINIPQIKLIKRKYESHGNYHKYVIFAQNRDLLKKHLDARSIPNKIHYHKPLPMYSNVKSYVEVACECYENALSVSQQILSLPIHAEMLKEEVDYVCDAIEEFYNEK